MPFNLVSEGEGLSLCASCKLLYMYNTFQVANNSAAFASVLVQCGIGSVQCLM